jgi:predicted O-methyltransferase YrrM
MNEQEFNGYADEHGAIFRTLIEFNRFKTIVEIGVAKASTTCQLCAAAKATGGKVHGFDIFDVHGLEKQFAQYSTKEWCEEKLRQRGFSNFILSKINTSTREFNNLIGNIGEINFAFIDGCHSYDGLTHDFDVVYPNLSTPGMIAFHDTLRIDGCREFVHDLRTKYFDGTYDIVDFPFGNGHRRCGISLLVKRTYPVLNIPCDEVSNLQDRREEIYKKEKDWYAGEIK